ncbi:hypothetical protein DFJ58DRAFT_729070 [Suillus subalutaceus]|uniref:uncharacterized protein n=1 Tax=Suillus subalutaceus TaxID=48586 RepID=UPI001B867E0B|nr:uncharacterized protein DFJ58DRAFT_729070 [Suillus subalutaceus]KAG1851086.1 hypothetical protein DFJ58DRAFT_729070 [Suillus subalutaceus]
MQQTVRLIAVIVVVAGHGGSGQEVVDKPAPFPTVKAVKVPLTAVWNTSCPVVQQPYLSTVAVQTVYDGDGVQPYFDVCLGRTWSKLALTTHAMAARNAIKLELPMEVKAFKFTFECRTPGPITVEISIGKPLQQLSSQAGIVEGPDTSDTHTETPGVLDDWLKAQKTQYQSFLSDVVKGGPLVLDDSVTGPESELTAEDIFLSCIRLCR